MAFIGKGRLTGPREEVYIRDLFLEVCIRDLFLEVYIRYLVLEVYICMVPGMLVRHACWGGLPANDRQTLSTPGSREVSPML